MDDFLDQTVTTDLFQELKEMMGRLKRHTYAQERFSYDLQAYYDKVAKL